ncbi:hypothetical protein ABPG74_009422 [Tetrahymena malaccensis]
MSKQQVEKIVFTIFLVLAALDITLTQMNSRNHEVHNLENEKFRNADQGDQYHSSSNNKNSDYQEDTMESSYQNNGDNVDTTHHQTYENNKERIRNKRKINNTTGSSYQKRGGQKYVLVQYCVGIPNVQVEGTEYPITAQKQLICNIITAIQYGGIALMFFGDALFQMIKITPPQWYYSLKENKWTTIIFFFMVGNMIISQISQSGAFEVFCNDNLIFSKIQSNRMPSLNEIIDPISNM